MSKVVDLKDRINKLESEYGISYKTSIYEEEISNNSTYLLYKYMQLLDIRDNNNLRMQYQSARNLINQYEKMPEESLNAEQKQLMELKEDIDIEFDNASARITDTATAYIGQGEYEGIIWEPNSRYLSSELFQKHAKDLEGIFNVSVESINDIQKENDLFFNDPSMINNEQEEVTSKEKTEQITKDRIASGYEPASLIEEENALDNDVSLDEIEDRYVDVIENNEEIEMSDGYATLEDVQNLREELVQRQSGVELTEEQIQANKDIDDCIRYGWYEQAEVIIKVQLGQLDSSQEYVEAMESEVDQASDNQINNTISKNMHLVSIEETRDADYGYSLV